TECDFEHYKNLMPPCFEADAGASHMIPASPAAVCPTPATVNDPGRDPRYISLAECIAMALERGNVGLSAFPEVGTGFARVLPNDNLVSGGRRGGLNEGAVDAIRVLALDPALASSAVEYALSKFDAIWSTSLTWNNTDRPVGTALDAF